MASIASNAPTSDVGGSHIPGSGSVAGSTQPHPTSQPRNASVSHQQQHCLYGSDPSQGFIKTEYQEHEGKRFWFNVFEIFMANAIINFKTFHMYM